MSCFAVVERQRSVVVRPLDCDRTPVIQNVVATTAVVQPAEQGRHYTTFGGIPGRDGGNFPDVNMDGKLYGRQDESWTELGSAALADAGDFATPNWVLQQGYLTQHQSLAGYATETWVTNQGYVTTDTTYNNATTTVPGLMSAADKSKLNDVEAQATKNATDAHLLNRANHTGTQTLSTISDAGTAASRDVGTSSGNVMEVGAFGMGLGYSGTIIPDESDLNDYRSFGFFSQGRTTDTKNMLNIPVKQAFGMFVMPTSGNSGVAQLWFQYNQGGQFWFRGYESSGGWSPWRRVGATDLKRTTSTTLDNTFFHHINENITIPTVENGAPPVGSIIPCYLRSNTQRTVSAASGVTLRHSGTTNTGTATIEGYGSFTLSHVNTNEWRISGDLV